MIRYVKAIKPEVELDSPDTESHAVILVHALLVVAVGVTHGHAVRTLAHTHRHLKRKQYDCFECFVRL